MMNTSKLYLRWRQLFRFWSHIEDKSLWKEFYNEVALINFNRAKYFGYFLIAMGLFLLASDFLLTDVWETSQISYFLILDITAVVAGIIIMLISYINPPVKASDIKPWHKTYFYIYLAYHLLWGALISIIESKTSMGVPTYLVGVFAAATLYLHRGVAFLIYLIASLLILFFGLIQNGLSPNDIVTRYSSTIILIAIAWMVSMILMNTRKKSFLSKKDIENARDNLDATVKERTLELQKINDQLLAEISERQKFEKYLQAEKKKAEEADKLKSVFLANMSHEIRTPLNGIIGFGDLLNNPALSDEKKERYIEIIRNNGQQLLKLIDDLMDISMIESNQLKLNIQKFRVSYLFPDAEVFFNDYLRINKKDQISIINDGISGIDDDTIESDPSRVQQILYNLLGNATKFTHVGHIRFGGKIENNYILIYVEDTGIGINKENSQRIFKRFRQGEESASRTYGGTGLGLSISEGIVTLLGGMIWIDMSYRHGARFCFSLPLTPPDNIDANTFINKSLDYVENNAVVISENGQEKPGYLDYLANCHKKVLRHQTFTELEKSAAISGKILLLDLQDKEAIDYEKIFRPLKDYPGKIIASINANPENKKTLYHLGCHRVYENPVNIGLFFSEISELTIVD